MYYFELFDMPIAFILDRQVVQKKFYALSKKYHPDFYSNATEAEQNDALEKAADINKAWKIFANKDATMAYILREMGVLEEEGKALLPNDFLMEMMDLNEAVMEAKLNEDNSSKNVIIEQIQQIETLLYEPIKKNVENFNYETSTQEALLPIKNYYLKKKYLNRILEGLQ
jgi:molecular chaperone HscB